MKSVYALGCLALLSGHAHMVTDVNPLYHQHRAILFYFAARLSAQPAFICGNAARFQRASKGPRQSTGGGCHHIIERGGVRSMHVLIDAVVHGHLRVHPEQNRALVRRKIRSPEWPGNAFDARLLNVNDLYAHLLACCQLSSKNIRILSPDNPA